MPNSQPIVMTTAAVNGEMPSVIDEGDEEGDEDDDEVDENYDNQQEMLLVDDDDEMIEDGNEEDKEVELDENGIGSE